MKKSEALDRWENIRAHLNPLEHMSAIPAGTTGSRYGACGIRIDGSPEFIDAVLSNLKELLAGESDSTRLELARSEVKPTVVNGETKQFANAVTSAEVCYIRLHERR